MGYLRALIGSGNRGTGLMRVGASDVLGPVDDISAQLARTAWAGEGSSSGGPA